MDGPMVTASFKDAWTHLRMKKKSHLFLFAVVQNQRAVGAATGRYHSLVLIEDGNIFGFGLNQNGQCGIGNTQEKVLLPTKVKAVR